MNVTSLNSGARWITHGSRVSNVAAMMGSTAFLAPLMATSPWRGTPPLINRLSMRSQGWDVGGEKFVETGAERLHGFGFWEGDHRAFEWLQHALRTLGRPL